MESTMNNLHPDTTAPVNEASRPNTTSRPAGRPGDDVVRWAEFRLAMWIGGFALMVIISGQGLLFSAILDLKDDIGYMRADIQKQGGDLRAEMQKQDGLLRAEMRKQDSLLRAEMRKQDSLLRAEMQKQDSLLRAEMQKQDSLLRAEMQKQFGEQRERFVRIETHLGIDVAAPDKEG